MQQNQTTTNASAATTAQNGLGTPFHPLKKGDIATIKNTTLGGRVITEGRAKILAAANGDDRYLVEFSNGDRVERFVPNHES